MFFVKDYREPFWRGFAHAFFVLLYCVFVSLLSISLGKIFNGEIVFYIQVIFTVFLFVVSLAVLGYLIFFEPTKKLLHRKFKAASVMMASTLGWLLIFLTIFLIGFIYTL